MLAGAEDVADGYLDAVWESLEVGKVLWVASHTTADPISLVGALLKALESSLDLDSRDLDDSADFEPVVVFVDAAALSLANLGEVSLKLVAGADDFTAPLEEESLGFPVALSALICGFAAVGLVVAVALECVALLLRVLGPSLGPGTESRKLSDLSPLEL